MNRILLAASLILICAGLAQGRDCPPAPPPTRDIIVHGYYGDARKSIIDPEKQQQNRLERKDVTTFINGYLRQVDRFVETGDRNSLKCANDRLARWAEDGAMLGSHTFFGEAIRNWAVISISLAYLKSGPSTDAAQDRLIKAWIRQMTSRAITFFGERKSKNNHFYWSGLAAISAAVVLDDKTFWDYGLAVYARAMNDIRSDGTIAAEMKRGQRAAHYHAFAAAPLTGIARVAELRGQNLFLCRGEAHARLLRMVDRLLEEPDILANAAAAKQDQLRPQPWMLLAQDQSLRTKAEASTTISASAFNQRWGGSVRQLDNVLKAKAKPTPGGC